MLDLLVFVLIAWIVTAAGRSLLCRLRLMPEVTGWEPNLFAFALGLGLLAYGMLALGLLHGLYPVAVWLLIAVMALLGVSSHAAIAREIRSAVRRGIHWSPWGWAVASLFFLLAIVPLIGVWTPPTLTREWDSLAYHLADPKLYAQAHRIYPLPWESHSNFAFTAEMWYLFSLIVADVPLAKLFHLACGLGTCLAIAAFGRRHLSPQIGLLAALLFGSTPLVLWEAGIAYADLATTFFATLALLAVANSIVERDERRLLLGAVMMGLALSTKATSLTTLALLAVGLLFWRLCVLKQKPVPALRALTVWVLLALTVGCPWYIKSAFSTGNPVYPFYYKIFGGRGFSAALAARYDASNANFGVTYDQRTADSRAVRTPDMAALVPWNLTMYLLPGHLPPNLNFRPFNDFQWQMNTLSPLLLAALFFPAFGRGAPAIIKALGLYALISLLFWVATMQYIRYLLPLLPVLCLLAAWVQMRSWIGRWLSGYALAGLAACSLVFSLYTGAGLVRQESPVVFGLQPQDDYITHNFAAYPAMQYINLRLPPGSKIVFYGNPLGFYCDKAYLWGDAQHSTVIPYDKIQSVNDLLVSLRRLGVTHILVNRRYFGPDTHAPDARWVSPLIAELGPPVFDDHGVAVYSLK